MSRFFIHIVNGNGTQHDEVGQDFPDARLAAAEACKTAGEMMHDETIGGGESHATELTVEAEDGTQIAKIRAAISFTM